LAAQPPTADNPDITTADRVTLLRLMAKQIAKQVGLMVTFMPKPYTEAWGSGAHFNMSLTDVESGQNLFRDPEDRRGRGWSKTAYGFTAGIMRHAPALAAICTPTPSLVLPRDRILPFLQGPLVRASAIANGFGVVVALSANPVELLVASDIGVRFLLATEEPRYVFRVSERIALRIKEQSAIGILFP